MGLSQPDPAAELPGGLRRAAAGQAGRLQEVQIRGRGRGERPLDPHAHRFTLCGWILLFDRDRIEFHGSLRLSTRAWSSVRAPPGHQINTPASENTPVNSPFHPSFGEGCSRAPQINIPARVFLCELVQKLIWGYWWAQGRTHAWNASGGPFRL